MATSLALALLWPANPALSAPPIAWLTDGHERIKQDESPRSENIVELYAARGEWEAFQVIVRSPSHSLSNVNVTVSDLEGPAGVISKSNITLYREHYIYDSGTPNLGINRGEGEGWYADALIPFVHPDTGSDLTGARFDAVPFDVSAGRNQPVWADIFVPRDAKPGRYISTVTITSNQGTAHGTVALNVWNFEMPLKAASRADTNLTKMSKAAAIELLKHKISPRVLPDLTWQEELVGKFGMQTVHVGFWTGIGLSDCQSGTPVSVPSPPSVTEVRAVVDKYTPDLTRYAYFADEIGRCFKQAGFSDKIKAYAKRLQEGGAVPLLTDVPTDRSWIPGPYIWVLPINAWNGAFEADFRRARNAGQELWTSHVLYQDGVSPKWFIDYPPVNLRIHAGFLSQSFDIDGLLIWKADSWRSESKGWTETKFHGDGHLVYPGSQIGVEGVVGGMRLKWVREGLEDYEYVELLKKAGQGTFALSKVRSIAPDLRNWTKDMNSVRLVRQELGQYLHELARKYRKPVKLNPKEASRGSKNGWRAPGR